MNRWIQLILATSVMILPVALQAGELRIRLTGIDEASGSVRVALFAGAEDFSSDQPTAGHFTVALEDGVEIVFANVSPGTYGISSFHDANGNNELDTNLVGLPTESFGFSRNARGSFGPPKFEDFSFVVGEENLTLEIELR